MSLLVANDITPLLSQSAASAQLVADAAVTFISNGFTCPPDQAKQLASQTNCSAKEAAAMVTAVAKLFSESAKRQHNELYFRRAMSPYMIPGEPATLFPP